MEPEKNSQDEVDLYDLGEEDATIETHTDERWLVSYADMMTLLFGFFVLLYAMAGKFDVIQKAAHGQFDKTSAQEKAAQASTVNLPLDTLQEERQKLKVRVAELELENKHLADAAAENKKNSTELEELRETVSRQKGQVLQAKQFEKEAQQLRSQLAIKNLSVAASSPKPDAKASVDAPESQEEHQGQGGGGNSAVSYSVSVELPGGGTFESRVHRISLAGIQLAERPPESLGQNFKVILKREGGGSIEVMCYAINGPDGQHTRRLAITEFPNGDERIINDWFKPQGGK